VGELGDFDLPSLLVSTFNTVICIDLNLSTKDIPYKLRKSNSFIRAGIWVFLILGFVTLPILGIAWNPVAALQLSTSTPSAVGSSSGAFITVTYIEPINVRSGPSSFDYPVVGSLPVGGTAPAIGRSPASEWIEIVFADAPRGTGWVYAANVSLSTEALLPIVEPPPTPSPVTTPTLNPTFVAAFQTLPTSTRLPTFTPPPTLAFATYSNPATASSGRAISAWVIVVLGVAGILGIILTSFRRR
jgi:uncharacterized protein YraI